MLHECLGQVIRRIRMDHGWSQEEFAARACLHVTYVSAIERGRRNPTLVVLHRVAAGLQVQLSTLLAQSEAAEAATMPEKEG